jgi:uncharacterized membrane protein YhdT
MAATAAPADTVSLDPGDASRLRWYNLVVGLIHLAQAILMLVLSTDFTLPVTRLIPVGPPGTAPELDRWFDLPLGPAVAAFLFLAAIDHLLMAAPGVNGWYNRQIGSGRNYARWLEYSVSASLMVALIAMITSVTDAGALIAIFGANTAMILFGWIQEAFTRPGREGVSLLPYWFGVIAGAVPWIVIVMNLIFSETVSDAGGPPTFVYGIIVSIFLFFNTFSVNMLLQYKQVGRWRSYVFGEKAYIVFSLLAKSALAWQVFANVLVG